MSYTGKYASSFSIEKDEAPRVPATLVIDVRLYISNNDCPSGKSNAQHAITCTNAVRYLLPHAEAHLRANPDGHVAFGCRLGSDRSPALAAELERRMQANPPVLTHHEELVKAQCVTFHGPHLVCASECVNAHKLADL